MGSSSGAGRRHGGGSREVVRAGPESVGHRSGITARTRLGGLRDAQDAALEVLGSLPAQAWTEPSGCPGWTVLDVVTHLVAGVRGPFGPMMLEVMRTRDIEALNDEVVSRRRDESPDAIIGSYRRWCRPIRAALAVGQGPWGGASLPLGELGPVPLRLFASALAFDTHTHLAWDIAPVASGLPAVSDATMRSCIEWMMFVAVALGQQDLELEPGACATFSFTGTGACSWTLARDTDARLSLVPGSVPNPEITVTSRAVDFPGWGTRRREWRAVVPALEAGSAGERLLDSLQII